MNQRHQHLQEGGGAAVGAADEDEQEEISPPPLPPPLTVQRGHLTHSEWPRREKCWSSPSSSSSLSPSASPPSRRSGFASSESLNRQRRGDLRGSPPLYPSLRRGGSNAAPGTDPQHRPAALLSLVPRDPQPPTGGSTRRPTQLRGQAAAAPPAAVATLRRPDSVSGGGGAGAARVHVPGEHANEIPSLSSSYPPLHRGS
ncbi:hypothetical protein GQ55_3G444300 [Panicum hallii var. hallii]|uniref:Uncharacterized protein n=1 Tax=Panicum hallii var. hallii TaxID=1504633 RepID=A0A2T7EIA4_9POAL|nr:hypothetical protein GQ55_3G444300 [Panicum hallii var. hallii]